MLTPDEPDDCLEAWAADEFGYVGVQFGPGGPLNSNLFFLDDYRESI